MLVREPIGMEGDGVRGSISLQKSEKNQWAYRLLYVFKRGLKLHFEDLDRG